MDKGNIWVVDDDESIRWVLERGLSENGIAVETFDSAKKVIKKLETENPSLILTDIKMPGKSGIDLLDEVKEIRPEIPIIIMTAHSDLKSAVESYEHGAWEYLPKPFDIEEAVSMVQRATTKDNTEIEETDESQAEIIGEAPAMQEVFRAIGKLSNSNSTVLLMGQSGTGKELVAKALFQHSPRKENAFIALNMADIPKDLLEAELFGHEKGAFTGADEKRLGRFEQANNGTLFLDEIGDMPLETQVKVLRVLESGEFMRVGDSITKKTDVRVIAATNKDLGKLVQEGKFRQDLYYRLKTVTINIPPLRNRKSDIRLLVDRFALQFSRTNDIKYKGFTPESIKEMQDYHWPGNIRELRNFVESILILQKGERISAEMVANQLIGDKIEQVDANNSLPVVVNRDPDQAERELILRQLLFLRQDIEDLKLMMKESSFSELNSSRSINQSFDSTIENNEIFNDSENLIKGEMIGAFNTKDLEKEMIIRTLEHYNNNRRAAAKSLGMSERTLYRKINDYGIEKKIKKDN